jgi:hypothetical protein
LRKEPSLSRWHWPCPDGGAIRVQTFHILEWWQEEKDQ